MQLIIVLGLIVKLASVSGECDVGNTVNNFDFKNFTGFWYFLYGTPGNDSDNFECPTDYYAAPVANRSRMVSLAYDKRQRNWSASNGFISDWDSEGYSQTYDGPSKWNGRIYIVAVDYKQYVIGKLCPHPSEKLNIFVAFRHIDPDDATMKEVKNALSRNNIDFSQLKDWNADRCQDLRVN